MSEENWMAVDRYIADLLLPNDTVLEAALEAMAAAGLPEISVSPTQGKMLMLLAQAQGARSILEIGTLGGYSTIWLGRALTKGGRLVTLEVDPTYAEVARVNIARAGLAEVVEIRIGSALETLPQLYAERRAPFDLIFIDADKETYPDYLKWAVKLSRPGTLIIADNVVRKGAIVDPADDDPNVLGARRFYELLAKEPSLTATVIQTVGSKGHDGFALIRVNGSEK
jgi:predicted O-methyltransferase YrrM